MYITQPHLILIVVEFELSSMNETNSDDSWSTLLFCRFPKRFGYRDCQEISRKWVRAEPKYKQSAEHSRHSAINHYIFRYPHKKDILGHLFDILSDYWCM